MPESPQNESLQDAGKITPPRVPTPEFRKEKTPQDVIAANTKWALQYSRDHKDDPLASLILGYGGMADASEAVNKVKELQKVLGVHPTGHIDTNTILTYNSREEKKKSTDEGVSQSSYEEGSMWPNNSHKMTFKIPQYTIDLITNAGDTVDPENVRIVGANEERRTSKEGEWKIYNGTGLLKTGEYSFDGEIRNGKPSGACTMKFKDGSEISSGDWRNGIVEGYCVTRSPDGTRYSGYMLHGLADGNGEITYSDGNKYSGTWSKGKPHGEGTRTFFNGFTLQDTWENGKSDSVEKIRTFLNSNPGAKYYETYIGRITGRGVNYPYADMPLDDFAEYYEMGDSRSVKIQAGVLDGTIQELIAKNPGIGESSLSQIGQLPI